MSNTRRIALFALAASSLMPIGHAIAQEDGDATEASQERRFGPITVTAQRREESLMSKSLAEEKMYNSWICKFRLGICRYPRR